MDIVVMQVLTAMGINLLIATLISAVLVVIANYIFSKLFVFNKKEQHEQKRATGSKIRGTRKKNDKEQKEE